MNNNPYGLVVELEQLSKDKVHFLDIVIDMKERAVQTYVYRKPTAISTYIPYESCDPFSYKIAAFRALVERAYTHSSTSQALQRELNYIRKIAKEHGYSNIIKGLCKQHRRLQNRVEEKVEVLNNGNEDSVERVPITYNPHLKAMYEKIAKIKGINIAYKRNPTIYSLLRNGKDNSNPNRLPGIYSIPLKDNRWDRPLVYIGSTKRSLATRLKEHKSDIEHNKCTTALSTYATNPDITPFFDEAHVIRTTQHPEQLKTLEAVEIF
ncbi:uncharacterized protein LOC111619817 [Centruroides sculpturatus]|uniref:uncharacterized protein LOC111619817 n=1 Tax=Centruroides sculpturatus TaxID=218467 RepID=UPI000C6C922B|nr:uncharacterized protein LOC111619817 [Centruroides sculpturatus]